MKPTKPEDPEHPAIDLDTGASEGLVKEAGRGVLKGLLKEGAATLKWGLWCALIGALVLGGIGFWKFGRTGLGIGALAGAIAGGVGGVIVYTQGTSLTM